MLDRIYHILVLDDGTSRFVFVSSGICLISPAEYDKVAAALERRTGIPRLNFWWSMSHTHSAPEVGPPGLPAAFLGDRYQHEVETEYTELAEQRLLEGVERALGQLTEARMAVGWGYALANINRRARDVEGQTRLGMNPGGPTDRRVGVLRFETPQGKPIALLANYPIHGTVLGGANLAISGDAPGVVAEYVQQQAGAPMIFLNGAAGDQAPIYSVFPDARSGHLSQFRALLGEPILEANRRMKTATSEIRISPSELIVETPKKEGLTWPAELADYARTRGEETLIQLPVRVLRLNDEVVLWSAPLELFSQIAVRVRAGSRFPYTFYAGYTNGWLGYLLTADEWQYGGYEPSVSPYTPRAQFDLEREVGAALDALP
ncbi:MAG: neutral/alkaline non-lysosomal ceramidase N-terminal domain-containing protein [Bryobacterales bacterium]|nr:neutral/alkaline non-lysosomal ceramidase N-terminal domain-containing protein [Bryobacterales bacterium]